MSSPSRNPNLQCAIHVPAPVITVMARAPAFPALTATHPHTRYNSRNDINRRKHESHCLCTHRDTGRTDCSSPAAPAADYPTKPIRLVVGFAPGGGTDTTARAIGSKLGDLLGQQIIIDNRAGAAGNIATEIVAKAAPDGYTLLMGTIAALAINPSLYTTKLPFDSIKDFAPIIQAVDSTTSCRCIRRWQPTPSRN